MRVSNSLDPDGTLRIVGPDLGPNCLQRLTAGKTSRERAKPLELYSQLFSTDFIEQKFSNFVKYIILKVPKYM